MKRLPEREEISTKFEEENSPPITTTTTTTTTTTLRQQQETPTRRLTTMTDFSIDAILGNCANATTTTYNSNNANFIDSTFVANTLTPPTPTSPGSPTTMTTTTGSQQHQHQQQQASNKRPRPKKYKCPYCWVALSNTGQFRGHIRIHTGERPFKCDEPFCMKTFTRNEELTRHKRIHTGQRPYACDLCKKCFGRKDHLKKHMRTHERHALDLIKQSTGKACGGDYSAALGTIEQLSGEKTQEIRAYWSVTPERFAL